MAFKVKLKITPDPFGIYERIREQQRPVAEAAVTALRETADNAVDEGRANIAGAGRFSGGWLSGLRRRMVGATEGGEPSLQAKAIIFHKFGFAGVFEHGATIQGQPLLWIPTDPDAPRAKAASRLGKKLVSATVHGRPMLFDAADRDPHRKPLYIGVPSVRIPKKWRITEIVNQHAAQLALLFLKHFKPK